MHLRTAVKERGTNNRVRMGLQVEWYKGDYQKFYHYIIISLCVEYTVDFAEIKQGQARRHPPLLVKFSSICGTMEKVKSLPNNLNL